jgi:hypothetical protein
MRRIIITALIALTALGGVASADRDHRRWRNDHGGVRVERVQPRSHYRHRPSRVYVPSRTYVRPSYRTTYRRPYVHVVRRPIYVQAPVIRYRYYNYYQRPQVIAENYPPKAGYLWVPGQWTWNGYEWIWQAGHYQPDPNYPQYDYNYDNNQYYDGSYSQPYTQPYPQY